MAALIYKFETALSHLPQCLAFSQLFSCLLWLVSCVYLNHTGQGPSLTHTYICTGVGWVSDIFTFWLWKYAELAADRHWAPDMWVMAHSQTHTHTQMHRGFGDRGQMHSHIEHMIHADSSCALWSAVHIKWFIPILKLLVQNINFINIGLTIKNVNDWSC